MDIDVGREAESRTNTVYGIGVQTVIILGCLSVCIGVLETYQDSKWRAVFV